MDRSTGPWWRENAGLGMLVTLATWLVTGSPLVAVQHYRFTSRRLARIKTLQQANTAANERRIVEALTVLFSPAAPVTISARAVQVSQAMLYLG